jgi:hypothetical protein
MAYEKGLFFIAGAQNHAAALEHSFSENGRGNGLLTRALMWDGLAHAEKPLAASVWFEDAIERVPLLLEQLRRLRQDAAPAAFTQVPRAYYPVEASDSKFWIRR